MSTLPTSKFSRNTVRKACQGHLAKNTRCKVKADDSQGLKLQALGAKLYCPSCYRNKTQRPEPATETVLTGSSAANVPPNDPRNFAQPCAPPSGQGSTPSTLPTRSVGGLLTPRSTTQSDQASPAPPSVGSSFHTASATGFSRSPNGLSVGNTAARHTEVSSHTPQAPIRAQGTITALSLTCFDHLLVDS